jgi:hypothetical protein
MEYKGTGALCNGEAKNGEFVGASITETYKGDNANSLDKQTAASLTTNA